MEPSVLKDQPPLSLTTCACKVASVVSDSVSLWTLVCQAPWDSPGKNTRVDCHARFHGIFPCLLHLLPWQAGSLPLAPPGKPGHQSPPQSQVNLRWKWQWAQGSAEKSQRKSEKTSLFSFWKSTLALLPAFPSCLPTSNNIDAPTILNFEM